MDLHDLFLHSCKLSYIVVNGNLSLVVIQKFPLMFHLQDCLMNRIWYNFAYLQQCLAVSADVASKFLYVCSFQVLSVGRMNQHF